FCFFFSSRRRHTRFSRDWSSDVCSSDLGLSASNSSVNFSFVNSFTNQLLPNGTYELKGVFDQDPPNYMDFHCFLSWYKVDSSARSEERRVGKECRCRWSV